MPPKTSLEVGGMGHSIKRKEDPRFIRGRGTYVDDVQLPGMLYLDIVRSPFAHAKIKRIDSSKALATPGVLAVITGQDLAKYNLHWMPTLMSDTQMVLPVEKVMYQAQEVAAVLATSRYAAADELIIPNDFIDWERHVLLGFEGNDPLNFFLFDHRQFHKTREHRLTRHRKIHVAVLDSQFLHHLA